ncbi:uncharacterized membrane protein YidH (DUF202 family) [Arthrobacter ginsengisoli]|uniref:Uncharacterized membrane protein YidH (DUF202 family) n=1 Tax=Arthrobacter ginsengisoli TaxID=1356565 RepID=A0ABU1UBF3_9MICC|nr:DUF202 domain-containing protein [Arthrobacter ginsengisoli]MDR7082478.1 uncharacterized membrane protein YidH (DUF202 family) [Arthrobacter ginsengisoli]
MARPRPAAIHDDPGLQPERTDLAWRRTSLTLVTAACIFLRWVPHYGWFAGTLVTASLMVALGIALTQRRRYHHHASGIGGAVMTANVRATAAIAGSVVVLAALGIYTVLYLPLQH